MLLCLSTGFIYLLFFLKYPLFYSVLSFCSFCFTTLVFSRTYSFLHCQGITWQIIWFFSLSYGTYGNWTSKKASSGEAPKDIIALKKSFMLSCEIQFSGRYEHLLHLKLFFVLKLEMLSCVPVDFSFFQVGCGFVCLQLFYNLVSLGWHKTDFFFLSLSHYIQYCKLIFFFSKQVDQTKYCIFDSLAKFWKAWFCHFFRYSWKSFSVSVFKKIRKFGESNLCFLPSMFIVTVNYNCKENSSLHPSPNKIFIAVMIK